MAQDRNQITMVLVCCLAVVSIVALILGIISLSQSRGGAGETMNIYTQASTGGSSSGGGAGSSDDRVWMFAIGHYDNVIEYLDEKTNTIKGYSPDIVDAVCSIANKNCRLVYDIYENCWNGQEGQRARGGLGLMSGWYDACTGWIETYERLLTFYFSDPYHKGGTVALFARNDSTVTYNNLVNLKIGFNDGWYSDEFCLARYTNIAGSTLRADQIFHYQSTDRMIDAVINGDIDVVFSEDLKQYSTTLKRISPPNFENKCQAGAGAIMTRHNNRELVNWWNDAFQRLRQRGRYNEICETLHERHGHVPGEDYTEICIGY